MSGLKARGSVPLIGVLVVVLLVVSACGSSKGASGSSTTSASSGRPGTTAAAAKLVGPMSGGHVIEPLSALPTNLDANGYVEQEFFASGTATAFKAVSWPSNGKWSIAPTASASYRTRILVRRPVSPAAFNGTVVVEWMNVSGGESAPDWDYLNPALMAAGYAYVAVSAQALGVDGGTPILGTPGVSSGHGLIATEPARYATLHHPGDQYALDIFAQIAQALRTTPQLSLGGLEPKHLVAVGESQSAFYLTTFADALQPVTHAFDGIFIHSRGGTGAALNGSSITSKQKSQPLRIRTDLDIPVFMFETQTDLIELGYAPARQPNTNRIRTWEVAGTSHADQYLVGAAAGVLGCTTPINNGPQHNVVQAAFVAFNHWIDNGTPPPTPAPFQLASTKPAALALDTHGNVIGGVRTPAVEVPVSTLSGAAPAGTSEICSLFGSTQPFTPAQLASLYGTQPNYLAAYRASLDKAIAAGYILKADQATLLTQAQQVQFPT